METRFLHLKNGDSAPLNSLPLVEFQVFRQFVLDKVLNRNCRVSAFFAVRELERVKLIAVLANDDGQELLLTSSYVGGSYPALTQDAPQFHGFEREIFENFGVIPDRHPWLKPVRFNTASASGSGVTDYFTMGGASAHEVAVGPIHAGVIEPGHFRFQCMGEVVYSLEISLGYQHRGIEKMMIGAPNKKSIHLMETIAGDTTCSHAGNYCRILEALDGACVISSRQEAIRVLAWELERVANHVGDLGALAGDVAYVPGAGYCGRIRGEYLNMTAMLCGNRFGRNLFIPGGVAFDFDDKLLTALCEKLDKVGIDLENVLALMFGSSSVLDRFENTGSVDRECAESIGMVGLAARASGVKVDIRSSHPYGYYIKKRPKTVSLSSGDVFSRAKVRVLELRESLKFIRTLVAELPDEDNCRKPERIAASSIAVTLAEGWRGEICHVALTGDDGKFTAYKVVDPSFRNWFGLAMALRGEQISNFPICNKSFNLSYCGHDL